MFMVTVIFLKAGAGLHSLTGYTTGAAFSHKIMFHDQHVNLK